jgi:hypothetical protein
MSTSLNLLEIFASQQNKYVTALMEALFTAEEMNQGYIKEGEHLSTRANLDPERINLLKRMFPHLNLTAIRRTFSALSQSDLN